MKQMFSLFTMVLFMALASIAVAGQGMSHDDHTGKASAAVKDMAGDGMPGTFKHQAVNDGVRAEFEIMSLASMNMKDPDGATHHIMVKLFDDGMNHQIKNAAGKVKVIGPDKTEQTNLLKDFGGIYAANFSFPKIGKYGVICLTKIDGKKHLYKFWYAHK